VGGGEWKRPDPFIAEKVWQRAQGCAERQGADSSVQPAPPSRRGRQGKRRGIGKPLPFKLGVTGERLLLHSARRRETLSTTK